MLGTDDGRLPGLRRFAGWNRPRPQIDAAATATATSTDRLGWRGDTHARWARQPHASSRLTPAGRPRRKRPAGKPVTARGFTRGFDRTVRTTHNSAVRSRRARSGIRAAGLSRATGSMRTRAPTGARIVDVGWTVGVRPAMAVTNCAGVGGGHRRPEHARTTAEQTAGDHPANRCGLHRRADHDVPRVSGAGGAASDGSQIIVAYPQVVIGPLGPGDRVS